PIEAVRQVTTQRRQLAVRRPPEGPAEGEAGAYLLRAHPREGLFGEDPLQAEPLEFRLGDIAGGEAPLSEPDEGVGDRELCRGEFPDPTRGQRADECDVHVTPQVAGTPFQLRF